MIEAKKWRGKPGAWQRNEFAEPEETEGGMLKRQTRQRYRNPRRRKNSESETS